MGQVYQATDTKLNRQVALKILPEAFATDPDRLARFQREAQVLASLNHPGYAPPPPYPRRAREPCVSKAGSGLAGQQLRLTVNTVDWRVYECTGPCALCRSQSTAGEPVESATSMCEALTGGSGTGRMLFKQFP